MITTGVAKQEPRRRNENPCLVLEDTPLRNISQSQMNSLDWVYLFSAHIIALPHPQTTPSLGSSTTPAGFSSFCSLSSRLSLL